MERIREPLSELTITPLWSSELPSIGEFGICQEATTGEAGVVKYLKFELIEELEI